MAQNSGGYSGTLGSRFSLVLQANEIAVDTPNNRSLVQVFLWMTCVTNAGHVFNYAQTPGNYVIDGNTQNRSTSYDFNPGVGAQFFLANNDQFWIGHNSDGTRSIGLSASHDAQNLPYVGSASTSFTMGLTNIARYANITGLSTNNVSDQGFSINVNTDANCDIFGYSLDGGSTWTDFAPGATTGYTMTLQGLKSNQTYNAIVHVRRQDSGLWTNSGSFGTTTALQNKFFSL